MGSVDLREVDWVLTNRITEWHREHYLCSTTAAQAFREGSRGSAPLLWLVPHGWEFLWGHSSLSLCRDSSRVGDHVKL